MIRSVWRSGFGLVDASLCPPEGVSRRGRTHRTRTAPLESRTLPSAIPYLRGVLPAIAGAILSLLMLPITAQAQGAISMIFPNGGQRGTTVELRFGRTGVSDDAAILVEGDGIVPEGPLVKGVGKVRISADAAPGVRQLRLVSPQAGTSPRPFAVGTLPELLEKEPNNTAAQAQRLDALPVTVNGELITRPDLDVFRLPLKKGECLVVAGESRALGAPTNLIVRVKDAAGLELMVQMDNRTRDPLLGFTAPADGEYLVELQDVLNNYSNIDANYVWRVTFTKGPWLDSVSPTGAQRGTTAALAFNGWNLGGGSGPTTVRMNTPIPMESADQIPVSVSGAPNAILIPVGSAPIVMESEPNPPTSAQAVAVPAAIHGELRERGDADAFRFDAKAGETLLIDVEARNIGSLADTLVAVYDAAGKKVSEVDDGEGSRDPRFFWNPPSTGSFTAVIRDIASGSRGGSGYFYRLSIARPEARMTLTTPGPTLVLKPGAMLEVALTLRQEFQPGKITVTAEGLPAGVTAALLEQAPSSDRVGVSQHKLVLRADAGAKPGYALFRIVARAAGEKPFETAAIATWVLSSDRSGDLAHGKTERLLLVITPP